MEFFESGITFCTFDTVVATKAWLLPLLPEFERNEFVIRYLSSHLTLLSLHVAICDKSGQHCSSNSDFLELFTQLRLSFKEKK
jgi:hypothetical protein